MLQKTWTLRAKDYEVQMRIQATTYTPLILRWHISVAFLQISVAICITSYAQTTDENLIYIGLDTLTLNETIKNQREGPSIKFEYPINVDFDSAHFELVVNNQTIAIVPKYLRKKIVENFVYKTGFVVENLQDRKVLLRVILYLDVPRK